MPCRGRRNSNRPIRRRRRAWRPAPRAWGRHRLINTGDAELRYLAVSSSIDPEVCEYPGSGKVAAYCGKGDAGFYRPTRGAEAVDYWAGE